MTKQDKGDKKKGRKAEAALASTSIGFVGAGVMAESIIAGLLAKGMLPPAQIIASHPRADRRERLADRYGVQVTASNREAAADADLVLLTIKPQVLRKVMQELHGQLSPRQVVISIIAGPALSTLRRGLGHDAVVRVMPNTPAQVSEGMSVWAATEAVSGEQRDAVRSVLAALGEEIEVETEKYVDMATALSGTGPTYVFLMMEALVDAGVHMGFPRHLAEEIVLQTVSGSVSFARSSGRHLAELRNMVTSPGGTSAEAIYQMEKGGLRTVLSKSVYAAYQRTQTLAAEQESQDG
ncbi:MAG TPA: pyrroline-5-carboxylate reductase [Thermomicrobiales bacterium]|nr:pyrroline-5-carboxylate reductase [Thermomicrobiales bacterium]